MLYSLFYSCLIVVWLFCVIVTFTRFYSLNWSLKIWVRGWFPNTKEKEKNGNLQSSVESNRKFNKARSQIQERVKEEIDTIQALMNENYNINKIKEELVDHCINCKHKDCMSAIRFAGVVPVSAHFTRLNSLLVLITNNFYWEHTEKTEKTNIKSNKDYVSVWKAYVVCVAPQSVSYYDDKERHSRNINNNYHYRYEQMLLLPKGSSGRINQQPLTKNTVLVTNKYNYNDDFNDLDNLDNTNDSTVYTNDSDIPYFLLRIIRSVKGDNITVDEKQKEVATPVSDFWNRIYDYLS